MYPSITVVTPSYNQASFLEHTLRSVLCQRDDIHEYFVMDGGSTDGSVDIIKKYEANIDRWVSRKDKGQSEAIRTGFELATGDILCWLNSDDVFAIGTIRKVREAFASNPTWDVLTAYHARIDADGRILVVHRKPRESVRWARWGVERVAQPTCFFRRELYEAVGGLDVDLHCSMDRDLWCRMFAYGANWGHIPEVLAGFREHDQTKGTVWLNEYAEEDSRVDRRYPQFKPRRVNRWVGLLAYRSVQLMNGLYLRGRLDTMRFRGRKMTDVFGEWVVSSTADGGGEAV